MQRHDVKFAIEPFINSMVANQYRRADGTGRAEHFWFLLSGAVAAETGSVFRTFARIIRKDRSCTVRCEIDAVMRSRRCVNRDEVEFVGPADFNQHGKIGRADVDSE